MRTLLPLIVALVSFSLPAYAQRAEPPALSVGDTWKLSDGREIKVALVTGEGVALSGVYPDCPLCLMHWDATRSTAINATEADGTTPVAFTRFTTFAGPGWKWYDWPLELDKTWRLTAQGYSRGNLNNYIVDFTVKKFEEVKTKAGTFKAFRIERAWQANWSTFTGPSWGDTLWYAPEVKYAVKFKSRNSEWELTSYTIK